jgi:DNA-binding response OmpR family regulator
VLHVDADASHIASMCRAFAGDDVELITAATGEAGVELARALRPDLILLGLELPRMSGADTVAILRASEATGHIPIVALSSRDRQNVPGLSMFCRKPVPVSELVSMVRVLLARSREAPLRSHRALPFSDRPEPDACPKE